jgi:protein-S-isoprenylcysteine O-methyltransferase Ste14
MAGSTSAGDRTIGRLVADATSDISRIVRSEIALAKAEISTEAKVAGRGAGMLAAAGVVALLGTVFLLHAAAHGLGTWLPLWAAYLIVAVVLLLAAAVAAMAGASALRKVRPKPERTIRNAHDTVAALRQGR